MDDVSDFDAEDQFGPRETISIGCATGLKTVRLSTRGTPAVTDSDTTRPFVLHTRVVTGSGGGPDKTILNSPRFLAPLGYDSACAYLHPPGDPGFKTLQNRADELDAELIAIPDRGLRDISVISRLLKICRARNVSIWHGHDYKTDVLGLLLKQFHPMKLVSTVHGWGVRSWKTPLYHAIDRASLKHHDRVVCVSDDLLTQCLTAGIPIGRCCEIENAIDLSAYDSLPDRSSARTQFNISQGPIIGAVGRLSQEKAFDVLIRSVDQLIETGIDANLLIAGDGPERESLNQLISDLGREDRIRLIGHIADPRPLFAGMDVFALSSRSEGLPNVLLEALACGVPVVSTDVGGIPRVITHESDALLVRPDDTDGLTLALSRLISNPALANHLAEQGRRTVTERYSFEVRMRKMASLYSELIEHDPRQSGSAERTSRSSTHDERFNRSQTTRDDSSLPRPGSTTQAGIADSQGPPAVASTPEGVPLFDRQTDVALLDQTQLTAPTCDLSPSIRVELTASPSTWNNYLTPHGHTGFYQRAAWTRILQHGLQHEPVCLQAHAGEQLAGVLPLAFVESRLFGRFLVSLPYLNSSGVVANSPAVATALIDRAIEFADRLDVRYLELRHETPVEHPQLMEAVTDKVHMRLTIPATTDELWSSFKSKLRSQIRKPLNNESLTAHWGQHELLDEFYSIFTRNMRDLGTPPFSRCLFESILNEFPDDAELCCIRLDDTPVASGLLIHGPDVTEVPSASSLREYNSSSANMLLYWNLLSRAVERGQSVFDFGRSSKDSGTHRFKAQWGATESPAVWQHYVRQGEANDMRPNSGKFDLMIRAWQKLPVWVTKVIGPTIVRGIP